MLTLTKRMKERKQDIKRERKKGKIQVKKNINCQNCIKNT